MGRDIHVVLEKKVNGVWEYFDPGFDCFDKRNYPLFDFLNEIGEPGCPPELVNRRLRPQIARWIDSKGAEQEEEYFVWDTTKTDFLYGFGYITLERLVLETDRFNVVWVSSEFIETFERLGGVLPKGMHTSEDLFDEGSVGIRVFDEDDIYLRDYIYNGIHDLRLIAAEHDLQEDELRLCFAFDC